MSSENTPSSTRTSLLLMIGAIAVTLGLVIFWNYRNAMSLAATNPDQLPIIKQLTEPLEGVNHRGQRVSFADLRGKVWVLAYVFTHCPAGCEGVMGRLKELQDEFTGEEDLHFVALSMDPDNDTPEHMAAWGKANNRNMGDGNWWFMTGDTKTIRSYMSEYFRLNVTEGKDLAGNDTLLHEFKFVLVDKSGAIRYYYDPLGAETQERHAKKIRQDIKQLLKR